MFNQNIGHVIKTIRRSKKLTQQDLAVRLKTDKQFISKIEHGKANVTLKYVDKILNELNTPPKDIIHPTYIN